MTQATALPYRAPARNRSAVRKRNRVIYAFLLALTLPTLLLAHHLQPDAAGVGTHEQLGFAPCGFLVRTGWPCATCGYTTAFSHAAHGQLAQAFYVQPAGALLAIAFAAVAILSAWGVFTGAAIEPWAGLLMRFWFVFTAAVIFLGAWGYKIMLMQGTL